MEPKVKVTLEFSALDSGRPGHYRSYELGETSDGDLLGLIQKLGKPMEEDKSNSPNEG